MTARIRTATGGVDHLSGSGSIAPICGQRDTLFTFYEVEGLTWRDSGYPRLPICRKCLGTLDVLRELAELPSGVSG